MVNEGQYQQRLNDFKFEVAQEVGIPLSQGYNGNLKSKDAGVIGGHIGGKIGGHMVREMIRAYEASLT
nr:alpha/beta-type small acid-soluble spore protein [Desulfotruncus arcticus]